LWLLWGGNKEQDLIHQAGVIRHVFVEKRGRKENITIEIIHGQMQCSGNKHRHMFAKEGGPKLKKKEEGSISSKLHLYYHHCSFFLLTDRTSFSFYNNSEVEQCHFH